MQTPKIISFFTRLRFTFGVVLAIGLFSGHLAAFAQSIQDQESTYTASQDQGDADEEDQTIVRKAPEATVGHSLNILPEAIRPTWEISVVSHNAGYPVYSSVPLYEQRFFQTLFRQIISPNAP